MVPVLVMMTTVMLIVVDAGWTLSKSVGNWNPLTGTLAAIKQEAPLRVNLNWEVSPLPVVDTVARQPVLGTGMA